MENDLINDWILDADTCFDFASLFFASSALEFREARRKEWISNFMSWWDIFIVMNKVVETECRVVPLLPLHFTSITSKPLKKHHFEFEIFCRQFIIFSSLNNNTKTHIWQYFTRYGFEFKWRNPNRNGIFNYLIPCTYLIDQSFFFPWVAEALISFKLCCISHVRKLPTSFRTIARRWMSCCMLASLARSIETNSSKLSWLDWCRHLKRFKQNATRTKKAVSRIKSLDSERDPNFFPCDKLRGEFWLDARRANSVINSILWSLTRVIFPLPIPSRVLL